MRNVVQPCLVANREILPSLVLILVSAFDHFYVKRRYGKFINY